MAEKANEFAGKEVKFAGAYHKSVFSLLVWAWSRWPLRLTLVVVCSLIGRAAFLANMIFVGYWADSLCKASVNCQGAPYFVASWQNSDFILTLIVLTGVTFLATFIFQSIMGVTGLHASELIINEAMHRVSRAPAAFFDKNPVGRVLSRFSSDFDQVNLSMGSHASQVVAILVEVLLMLAVAGLTNAWFLPLFVLTGLLSGLIYKANKAVIRTERRNTAAKRSTSVSHFAATVQGASSIRSYQKEDIFLKKYSELTQNFLQQKCRTELCLQIYGYQLNLLMAVWVAVCGVAGIILVQHQLVSVGQIGLVLGFAAMASSLVQRFFTLIASLEQGLSAVERLNDYIHMPIEPSGLLPQKSIFQSGHEKEGLAVSNHVNPTLESSPFTMSHVDFAYGDDQPLVLKDFTLKVKSGESIGIIGRTGSGKSTIFKVLLGFYPIRSGAMTIGGKHLGPGGYGLAEWRRQFSYISQSPPVFRGTVRENLTIGPKRIADDSLIEMLDKVGLSDWIRSLQKGLDSTIYEGGANLSGGQKQLLAAARCLLRESPILLIDEATSSVDPLSEEIFIKITNQLLKNKTKIIIAHRLSTLDDCDRVLWLEGGAIRRECRPQGITPELLTS